MPSMGLEFYSLVFFSYCILNGLLSLNLSILSLSACLNLYGLSGFYGGMVSRMLGFG